MQRVFRGHAVVISHMGAIGSPADRCAPPMLVNVGRSFKNSSALGRISVVAPHCESTESSAVHSLFRTHTRKQKTLGWGPNRYEQAPPVTALDKNWSFRHGATTQISLWRSRALGPESRDLFPDLREIPRNPNHEGFGCHCCDAWRSPWGRSVAAT